MRAAYDALSDEMKRRLAGMAGSTVATMDRRGPAIRGRPRAADRPSLSRESASARGHPPRQRRRILFVNPLHTHGFQGMPRDEAWTLIEPARRPFDPGRFTSTTVAVGDVLMWDENGNDAPRAATIDR